MQIATFENETEILGFYMLRSFEIKTGKTNKQYADLKLEDKTGQINAKIWNTEGINADDYSEVMAVKVKGRVKEFSGALQLNIEKIRPVNAKDNVDIEELVSSAPIPGREMYDSVAGFAERIGNSDLRDLSAYFLKKYKEKLLYFPAAKQNHHSVRGGLLFHILKMLETSEAIIKVYEGINKDLLFTGVILHDIAKMEEMNASELGIVSEYSIEGELLGHITIGVNLVYEAGAELGTDHEVMLLVQHMILSHHYEAEYGSPKKPGFLEAELLHYIDMIDARIFDMEKAVKNIEKGTFSEPVFSIEKRRIYKPKI